MDIYVYTRAFELVGIVDQFESFIWTERYSEAGDFEIYTKVTRSLIDLLKEERLLVIGESRRFMVIEGVEITTDTENGDIIKVTGRSGESYLARRVIFEKRDYSNYSVQNAIKQLLIDNAIDPINSDRIMPGLTFSESHDPAVLSALIDETSYFGENLYDAVKALCDDFGLGFKIEMDEEARKFIFSLYKGADHSYDQETNPYVIFSKSYGNLLSSDYIRTTSNIKNTALVLGEPGFWLSSTSGGAASSQYYEQMKAETGDGSIEYDRREIFVDGTDIARTVNEEDLNTATERTVQQRPPVTAWSDHGQAPAGLQVNDYVQTNGGMFQIVEEGTPGARYNPDSGYWSVKVDNSTKVDNPDPDPVVEGTIMAYSVNGQAPSGLPINTFVKTGGGTYKIVEANTPGANYNPNSGYWSIKVSNETKSLRSSGLLKAAREESEGVIIVQSVNGQAPEGLDIGTYVKTNGGMFRIVEPGTAGARYNPSSGYWSVKVGENTRPSTSSVTGQPSTDARVMSGEEYVKVLKQKGDEELSSYVHSAEESFNADVVTLHTFVYGTDYYLGDILQVENEYGISAKVRVSEFIRSIDTSGINYYPTFITI